MMNPTLSKGKLTWKSALFFILSTIYVISPVDLMPDVMPIIGQADDFCVILLNLCHIYRLYKKTS